MSAFGQLIDNFKRPNMGAKLPSGHVWKREHRHHEWRDRLRWRRPLKHCTQILLSKLLGECSDRVRIFQELYKKLI